MFKWLNGLIDRIFVVAGAVLFSQAPHFYQQYLQRLGGHVEELKLQTAALQQAAAKSGKTFGEVIQKFLSNTDLDFAAQGEVLQSMFTRYSDLNHAYSSLANATVFTRPFVFLKYFQFDIAKMTLADFTFGLTLTVEAGVYALAGMMFGYFLYRGLAAVFIKMSCLITGRKHRHE